jgi:hypothetical protein
MEASRLMAQRFISIRNFEKYNPGSTRSYPWIKVYRTMLLDIDFLQLDVTSRYLYVCLLILASDHANKIPMSVSYLSHRCAMNVSETMLKPLYRLGFLQASRSTIARLEKRENREEEMESRELHVAAPIPKVRASIFPDGFEPDERAQSLATSYGLNPHKELAAFRDHHTAKGSVFKDWQAAFRNWLRNSLKFNQRNGHAMSRV